MKHDGLDASGNAALRSFVKIVAIRTKFFREEQQQPLPHSRDSINLTEGVGICGFFDLNHN